MEIDGFLASSVDTDKKFVTEKYSDFFDYAKDINRYCMAFLKKLKVSDKYDSIFIIHTLFLRLLEYFQGVFILLERGMMPPAKVLTRGMLEIVFILAALEKNPALLSCYFDQFQDGRKKALKAALQFKNDLLRNDAKKHDIEKHYVKLKKELCDKELRVLKPKEWAIEAEMEDFYNLYYVSYSNAIHSNLAALDDHLDETMNGLYLSFGPSDKDLYEVLKCCIYIIVNAAQITASANQEDITNELEGFKTELPAFDEKYLKDELTTA
jgi:hypothetical protein